MKHAGQADCRGCCWIAPAPSDNDRRLKRTATIPGCLRSKDASTTGTSPATPPALSREAAKFISPARKGWVQGQKPASPGGSGIATRSAPHFAQGKMAKTAPFQAAGTQRNGRKPATRDSRTLDSPIRTYTLTLSSSMPILPSPPQPCPASIHCPTLETTIHP